MIPRIVLAGLALAALPLAAAQAQVSTSGTLRTGGVYRASPPALSDQQLAPLRLDGTGALVVTANLGTLNGAATAANQAGEIAALGTPSDTAYGGSGTASLIALLKGVYNIGAAPTPAGTNVIGKVGIDQTTPGTTNGVVATPASGANITTAQPSVTTTAASISAAGTYNSREICLPPSATASIFLGASGVTPTSGYELFPGACRDFSRFSGALFAVAASTQTARLVSY